MKNLRFYAKLLHLRQALSIVMMLIAVLLWTAPVLAQQPTADEINAVAEYLNCPTCQALNLADCDTQTCAQWKDQIGQMIAQGYTNDEILAWYAQTYGQEVLQEPPFQGVGLYAWLLPILVLLIGLGCYGLIVKQWSARQAHQGSAGADRPADDYLQRVEQELKELS